MKKYLLFALCLWASVVNAGQWPEKPIKLIVAYPVGGITDITTRTIQRRLEETLKQPVIVENVAGVSGSIGADRVAKATDEYTFLVTVDEIVTNSILDPDSNHKLSNYRPVAYLGHSPVVLTTAANGPYKNARQVLAEPRLTYASAGVRSIGNLVVVEARPKWTSVPYKGGSQMFVDVISGNVNLSTGSISTAATHVNSGKVIPLMIFNRTRIKQYPDVPTSFELGVPVEGSTWIGVMAPKHVSDNAVKNLSIAIIKAMSDPELVQPLINRGLVVEPKGQADFSQFLVEKEKSVRKQLKNLPLE